MGVQAVAAVREEKQEGLSHGVAMKAGPPLQGMPQHWNCQYVVALAHQVYLQPSKAH